MRIMGAAAVELRGPKKVTEVAAQDRFGRYGPGKRKRVGKADVREDEVLQQLKSAWKRWNDPLQRGIYYVDSYDKIYRELANLKYSSIDVENFSLALSEFEGEEYFSQKAGIFLSALINGGDDSDYVIHTAHLKMRIFDIGYKNRKNIIVKGSVGIAVGWEMESGSIVVEGNAGEYAGHLMKGGSIVVNGNAGKEVGFDMKGGEIHLQGDYEDISSFVSGGNIYYKGKLIVDK